jgi:hypothetical protein
MTTWTLLIMMQFYEGVSTQQNVFLSKKECLEAGKSLEEGVKLYKAIIRTVCYQSQRIDVK